MDSSKSSGAKRAWVSRRANAAAVANWFAKPVCLCGCRTELVRHRNPDHQRLFRPGHDARLKSVAASVIVGAMTKDRIPDVARALKARIGFLRTTPGLAKAF
jgi:hypothetical protein